jgi:fatty-acyl-CoA synthase
VEREELLWEVWVRRAQERPEGDAIVHWRGGEPPFRWRWRELVTAAGAAAATLRRKGVRAGHVCAIVLRHHPAFYPLYLGVSALGAIPAVLAYPNARLHPDKFAAGLAGMARRSGMDFILTERPLEAAIRPLVTAEGSTIRGLVFPLEDRWDDAGAAPPRPEVSAADPCLLQHSSGTTGLQKAVVLSHRAVLDHVRTYAGAIALDPARDRIVSWLPLYHDMGLIAAFQMALAHGVPLVQMDPFEWVAAPALLFQAAAAERGTVTWLPNFAYNLLADRVRDEELAGVRLDGIRMFVNCSEPVRAESHARFLARFARHGVRRDALAACYAMAETTFAATQTAPGVPARTLDVDRDELARGRAVPATAAGARRACVSSGPPISGCEIEVLDDDGHPLGPGRVGELAIRSPALFDGYRNDPASTARVLESGRYRSGDLGFVWDGEVYVVGRKKDLIIVAGNNVFPEDVEDAVGRVAGVVPGRVVAFGVEDEALGTERIHVVAETAAEDEARRKRITAEVIRAGMAIDVTISRVHLVPPRWLIKSSSGKPSRKANRERVLAGEVVRAPAEGVA